MLKEFEQNFDLLRKLIEPLGVNEFLRDYYEKKPLLSPNNKCRNFDDLISLKKLDHLLATSELPPASIDMARSKPPMRVISRRDRMQVIDQPLTVTQMRVIVLGDSSDFPCI